MSSITVATEAEILQLPAADAPELRLNVWPPEALEGVLEEFRKRHRLQLNPDEVYDWTGRVKVLKGKRRSRRGWHHTGKGRKVMAEGIRLRGLTVSRGHG